MGKKGGNKQKNQAQENTAPQVKPASTVPVQEAWKEDLSPEEREAEEKKAQERQRKAEEAARRQKLENERKQTLEKAQVKQDRAKEREDKKWTAQLNKSKVRALQEGVLEAQDWGNDIWMVELNQNGERVYKEVQGEFYCTLCWKHLNSGTLEAHIETAAHKRKVEWARYEAAASQVPQTPPGAAQMPTMQMPEVTKVAPAAQATPEAPQETGPRYTLGLPPGWESGMAGDRLYFFNRQTGESRWDPPPQVLPALPQGWMRLQDAKTGREYFYHAASNTTQWEFPTASQTKDLVEEC